MLENKKKEEKDGAERAPLLLALRLLDARVGDEGLLAFLSCQKSRFAYLYLVVAIHFRGPVLVGHAELLPITHMFHLFYMPSAFGYINLANALQGDAVALARIRFNAEHGPAPYLEKGIPARNVRTVRE